MRLGHPVDIPLQSRVSFPSSLTIPPIRDSITVGIPGRAALGDREVFEAADILGRVDDAGLAGLGAFVGGGPGERLVNDAEVVIVNDGLTGA